MTLSTAPRASADVAGLAREAAEALADALAIQHLPSRRANHRQHIERAIVLGTRALASAETEGHGKLLGAARSTLVKAYAARAQDARHGAGQLSLGAQRAPTCDDCDDGWQRVEDIVAVAESSAVRAAQLAAQLDTASAWKAARAAETAARQARRLVDERNHAYTFHADPGFSFGEGWYLAAAAVLAGVAIQVEPDKPQTAQAERFLRDAGLLARLRPYRSRPRANKHLPAIVAQAFRPDPFAAQRALRAALLGNDAIPQAVIEWIDRRLPTVPRGKTVLLWVRYGKHHPMRNTEHAELVELARHAQATGLLPILIGDALQEGAAPPGAVDMTLFWKDAVFQGEDMRRAQLQFFEHLKDAHGLVGQIGVTTAGMDGPALMGLPTLYLTHAPNPRLGTWVGAVPGYREVVRQPGYLDRIRETLGCW